MKKNSSQNKPTVNRIIIGDVGSGKTIVTFIIGLVFQKNIKNTQIVLTAPTEVLAFQHYQNFLGFINSLNHKMKSNLPKAIYLSSGKYYIDGEQLTKQKFLKAYKEISGSVFWIGTHAIFHSELVKPELVFIDEQHRFGVEQRKSLTQNNLNPHFISMSATPIPRTLALTFYELLKPHFLETLPNRNIIKTTQNTFENFDTVILSKIKNEVSQSKKVYVVCPSIEDKEESELWSTTKTTDYLKKYFKEGVLTVHGKDKEKKSILQSFRDDPKKQILVATTVVEVGVDIPDATLVIILNSERFGLSALHQIRGRVGRNSFEENSCILVTYEKYKFIKRLNYLTTIHSGFDLSEKDLELRGSGQIVGKLQSGFNEDIDDILDLDTELYNKISEITQNIDYSKLFELPRLKKYLKEKINSIHVE
jgi:ATP-dependent DNA helicase RecG